MISGLTLCTPTETEAGTDSLPCRSNVNRFFVKRKYVELRASTSGSSANLGAPFRRTDFELPRVEGQCESVWTKEPHVRRLTRRRLSRGTAQGHPQHGAEELPCHPAGFHEASLSRPAPKEFRRHPQEIRQLPLERCPAPFHPHLTPLSPLRENSFHIPDCQGPSTRRWPIIRHGPLRFTPKSSFIS